MKGGEERNEKGEKSGETGRHPGRKYIPSTLTFRNGRGRAGEKGKEAKETRII